MPRHYTDEEKRLVLDRLIANHGDVDLTVLQTNVPERTIARWKQLALRNGTPMPMSMPPPMPPTDSSLPSPVTMGEGLGLGVSALPPETTEAFQTLHDKLLTILTILINSIEETIPESPFNQRIAAIPQIMNTITKINALLPHDEEEIEYVYEYEVEHHVEKKKDSEAETEDQASGSPYQPTESAGE